MLYLYLIEAALGEAARKAFSMFPRGYEFQGPTGKKAKAEGIVEGQLMMAAANVLEVLEARGLPIPDSVRERVQGCSDLDQLRAWVRRAATVKSAEELFDE